MHRLRKVKFVPADSDLIFEVSDVGASGIERIHCIVEEEAFALWSRLSTSIVAFTTCCGHCIYSLDLYRLLRNTSRRSFGLIQLHLSSDRKTKMRYQRGTTIHEQKRR